MYKVAHVAYIVNKDSNGISNVVPNYVKYQSKYVDSELINLNTYDIDNHNFEKQDLFVLHGVYNRKMLFFYNEIIKGSKKYIIVPHGGLNIESQRKSHLKKVIANNTIFRQYYRNACAIQYLCEYEKQHSIIVNHKDSIICPNGISIEATSRFTPTGNNGVRFIYVGRLNMYHKGIDILVDAISSMKTYLRRNNASFDIIGVCRDNTDKIIMNRIEKLNLSDLIYFDNKGIFGQDKTNRLCNSDCFIQTSRLEGLPLGVLEAMSIGVPVAVTDPCGVSETIDKYGCGFHCQCNVEGVSSMIRDVIENRDQLGQMANNSIAASKEYNWDQVSKVAVDHYIRIIKEG